MAPKNPRQRTSPVRPVLLAGLLLATGASSLDAQRFLDAETEQLLVAAVEAATELDLYYARCRSDLSGRRTDNLNKELVSNFRITVLEVEDDLFPERSYRRARERMQRDFFAELKAVGGCREAKAAGMPARLRRRYDELMRALSP